MFYRKLSIAVIAGVSLCSCDSAFMAGMLDGMAMAASGYGTGTGYYPAVVTPTAAASGGNLDYLLDPNYAIMQVQQQNAQYNATFNALMNQTVQQVKQEEADFKNNYRQQYYAYSGQYPDEEQVNRAYYDYLAAKNGGTSSSTGAPTVSTSSEGTATYTTVACGTCGGTGTIVKNDVPTFGSTATKHCSLCNKTVSLDHYHVTCPTCHGSRTEKRRQ